MTENWKFIEEFTLNANRLNEIFLQKNVKLNLSFKGLEIEAKNDEMFSFALHWLIEEMKCRGYSINFDFDFKIKGGEYFTIESWFKKLIAGIIFEPFPSVEHLLKEQNRPSIFPEFDSIFMATKLLNSLAKLYDPNIERIEASNIISIEQYEIYQNLPRELKEIVDSVFIINVPKMKESESSWVLGPSFRFEMMNYIDFDSKSDFKSIPIQLLEVDEGIDQGSPFGKRWSHRLIAKSLAYDKINFNLIKIGSFPSPAPKSLESSNINFNVQLPETVGIDLLHQNSFDNTIFSPEFLDHSAFTLHFAKFLHEIPTLLTQKLKNTDIFAHAPLINAGKTGAKASLASFRALLLVTGILGHLTPESLPPVDIHEILNFDSEGTSACLLLGLALSTLKTPKNTNTVKQERDKFLTKLFTMHLPSFQTNLGLDVPPILQLSASLSLGFFKFRSFDRGIAQLLLKEIFRPLPLNINFKASEDSPLLSIIPAFTLGMCLMAPSSSSNNNSNNSQFAEDVQNQLNSTLVENGNKTQHQISVLIALTFINIENSHFNPQKLPWSRSLPDLLDKAEGVVFWCHLSWRLCQWNSPPETLQEQSFDKVKLNFETIFDSICVPASDSVWIDSSELGLFVYACQCLMANSVYFALKFAGTHKSLDSLDFWIKKLSSYQIIRNIDTDYFLTKIQTHLLSTYQYLLLCKCVIFAGSGNSSCWALLRKLMADPLMFKYGNGRLFYSSIGVLLAGKGRLTLKTEENGNLNYLAVASLLAVLIPFLPASPVDSEFSFVTLMDCLWPLSVQSIKI